MPHFHLEQLQRSFAFLVVGSAGLFEALLRFADEPVAKAHLIAHETVDAWLQTGKRLLTLDRSGAGNDQRRAGFVDEDRVNFIDDAEPVVALNLVLFARR